MIISQAGRAGAVLGLAAAVAAGGLAAAVPASASGIGGAVAPEFGNSIADLPPAHPADRTQHGRGESGGLLAATPLGGLLDQG